MTGGAGFIGSHIVPLLLDKGYAVTVLDNFSSGKPENLNSVSKNPKLSLKVGDIRNSTAVHEAFQDVDAVIHLAALIDVSASVTDPFETTEVNVAGTLEVLNEAVKSRSKRFVLASSTAVYGEAKELPIKENAVIRPLSPYAASKVAGEAYCSAFASCYGLSTVALRFFNVYGPKK